MGKFNFNINVWMLIGLKFLCHTHRSCTCWTAKPLIVIVNLNLSSYFQLEWSTKQKGLLQTQSHVAMRSSFIQLLFNNSVKWKKFFLIKKEEKLTGLRKFGYKEFAKSIYSNLISTMDKIKIYLPVVYIVYPLLELNKNLLLCSSKFEFLFWIRMMNRIESVATNVESSF